MSGDITRIRVYLAAPLFNPMERAFNEDLARCLEPIADVFLPQRNGALLTKLVAGGQSVDKSRKQIFEGDTAAIGACHAVVAVLDGRTIDEGVAFEVGYANALGKVCIAFKSDDRIMLPTGDNPMIVMACQYNCSTPDALFETVRVVGASISHSLNALDDQLDLGKERWSSPGRGK
jgi:nucleoside 2-deoxyribosyltransferase